MSLKYFTRLTRAYITRFKGIIIIGMLIGVASFFILNFLAPKLFTGNKSVIGITGRYRPNSLPENISLKISLGLTKIENSNVVPALASSWETPDKGKTWIFKLRDNIYWQDGTEIVSSDIVYDFSDVLIKKPDAKTIIFTIEKGPYAPFPSVLAKPIFKKGLLGAGEWKVDKIRINNTYLQELVLKNNRDILHYKFYPTTDRIKLAYKMGKIDTISETLDPTPFDSWNNTLVNEKSDKSQVVTLFFNTQDNFLSDKSLRQALFYALNKEALGERAESPINPQSWAYNPQLKPYAYDSDKAKQIIDKLPEEQKNILEIKLVSTPSLLSVAEKIAKDWKAVGLKTQILVSSVIPADFQAYLTIFDIPSDPDQYPIWHSTQKETNISKYASPRIDKFLEDGRVQIDLEERRKIYLDFQRYLLEDLPAAFLYYPSYFTITRK